MAGDSAVPEWYTELMDTCPPRGHTVPEWGNTEARRIFHKYMTIADLLGIVPMPWQKLVWAVLALPRCFEHVILVGRQQGKTTAVLVPIVDVLISKARHTVVYSAQRGVDAERKIREEFFPTMASAGLDERGGFVFNRGTADFGIHAVNGSHLRSMSSAKDSLRGTTRVALGIIDEARVEPDHNRSVLLTPTMTVVNDAKLVVASTAGHAKSLYLEDRLAAAREHAANESSTICLTEWGVTAKEVDEGYDPSDVALWKRVLPAIGYTVTEPAIRRAHETMEPHDFAMEYLGHWLDIAIDEAIPQTEWRAVCNSEIAPTGEMALALDAPPEQDRSVAVVSDTHGQVELIDVRAGGRTMYDWATSLLERHPEITTVALARNNTLRRTGERLAMDGHVVKWYDTPAMHMAAARFWEAVHSEPRQIAIRSNPILDQANAGAFRWQLGGGAWVFMRQSELHYVSPLIAATLAYDAAVRPGESVALGDMSYDDLWDKLTKEFQEDPASSATTWGDL